MAAPNDVRILTEDEMEQYAKDYHLVEDLSNYDFSSLNFDSDYFRSLPPAQQYSILNAARLRSRLRMGYSKEQLDDMFPDRLTFSKFQIRRLKERNDYTQRLMNLNGMNEGGPQRIAGEKGKEYYLVRNEGEEGGWVLGASSIEGAREKPVLLDVENVSDKDDDTDGDFEDVPLEAIQPEGPDILQQIGHLKDPLKPRYDVQGNLMSTPINEPEEGLFVIEDDDEDVSYIMTMDSDDGLPAAIDLSMQSPDPPSLSSLKPNYQYVDLTDLELQDHLPNTTPSEDSELNKAIALSLAQEDVRPVTSNSDDSDLQRALALSREDQGLRRASQMTVVSEFEDNSEELFIKFPLSAKDKGKGKATSPTPERLISADDDELRKTIELSKTDVRGCERIEGVGTSRDHNIGKSPLQPANTLGRSMFRRKQGVIENRPTHSLLTTEQEALEVPGATEQDVFEGSVSPVPHFEFSASEPRLRTSGTQATTDGSLIQRNTTPDAKAQNPGTTKSDIPSKAILQPSTPEPSQYQLSSSPYVEYVSEDRPQSPQENIYLSDDEDEELMAQLAAEAEEHARFVSSINPAASSHPEDYIYGSALNTNLTEEDFEREMRNLRNQQKKDRRDADEVNQLMAAECQQLLQLFGLPYIIAPMEAEAECAELVRLGLVDGVVTDDSDIFLFGGTKVYKNMFNQGKFVECYLQTDLERDFRLDRQKFINLAHLLGSDYAEGIPHIGPVNALELLSEFPGEHGLEEFRDWWIAVQQGRATKDTDESEFRRRFRKNSAKIFLPNDFPNRVIDQAYLKPEVDHDSQPFVWGIPDLDALRSFLMSQVGWSKERTDEILVPVIKDMNRRQVITFKLMCSEKVEGGQTTLTEYFEGTVGAGAFAPRRKVTHRSKRLSKAMTNLYRDNSSDDDVQEIAPRKMVTKRKRKPTETFKVESDEEFEGSLAEISALGEDSPSDGNNLERTLDRGNAPERSGKPSNARGKVRKKKTKV